MCLSLPRRLDGTDPGAPLPPDSDRPPSSSPVTTLESPTQLSSASGTSPHHFLSLAPYCRPSMSSHIRHHYSAGWRPPSPAWYQASAALPHLPVSALLFPPDAAAREGVRQRSANWPRRSRRARAHRERQKQRGGRARLQDVPKPSQQPWVKPRTPRKPPGGRRRTRTRPCEIGRAHV